VNSPASEFGNIHRCKAQAWLKCFTLASERCGAGRGSADGVWSFRQFVRCPTRGGAGRKWRSAYPATDGTLCDLWDVWDVWDRCCRLGARVRQLRRDLNRHGPPGHRSHTSHRSHMVSSAAGWALHKLASEPCQGARPKHLPTTCRVCRLLGGQALWHAGGYSIRNPCKFAKERRPACQSGRGQPHSKTFGQRGFAWLDLLLAAGQIPFHGAPV
jgi:hypothetical protein